MTQQFDMAIPTLVIRTERCVVCQEITDEACGQCGQPIHHSDERSSEVSCWVQHWKPLCKSSEAGATRLPPAAQPTRATRSYT